MPRFATPEHLCASLELTVGSVRVVASDRADTVVTVVPSRDGQAIDLEAAEQTRVEHEPGRIVVVMPKAHGLGRYLSKRYGSVDVTLELPEGSDLRVVAGVGEVRAEGRLGDVDIRSGLGDVVVDRVQAVRVKTHGEVVVGSAGGHAELTGAGEVRVGEVDGSAAVKNTNGRIWVGAVHGSVHANSANGDVVVDRAEGDVIAKTANGHVRVGEVVRDQVRLDTAYGDVEVGVRGGSAAWLDVSTKTGNVHRDLDAAGQPEPAQDTVRIRARTAFGDIVVRRADGTASTPTPGGTT